MLKKFIDCSKKYLSLNTLRALCTNNINNPKIYLETYGCQMNFSDSEIVLSILKSAGYSHTNDLAEAKIALLMTCAIREGAEEKIWNRLRHLHSSKRKGEGHLKVGILGCMAERLKAKLIENSIAPVDVVCGPDAYRDLPRLLQEATAGRKGMNVALSLEETYADVAPVRISGSGVPSAFVSIMRGCNNMCTYCIVPFTRGKERSRDIDSIVAEVRRLSTEGIREVVLLGQNVNSYRDLSESTEFMQRPSVTDDAGKHLAEGFSTVYRPKVGGRRFVDLLDAVSRVDPEMRIRFTSPHPKDFPDEVIHLIRERPNICNQLHLPAQSGSSTVLQSMGRGYTREAYLNLVDRVRSIIPGIALTSDFIAGFCGESEEDHQLTLSLLRAVKYHFVFCYPYSMREKTKAYHRLVDDVPDDVKHRRHLELAAEFRDLSAEVNASTIGSIQLVLVDGDSKRSKDEWCGRNDANTKVIFPKSALPLDNEIDHDWAVPAIGQYVAVKITSATSQTLRAVPICRSSISSFDPDSAHISAIANDGCQRESVNSDRRINLSS